jgi:hypothetical protein
LGSIYFVVITLTNVGYGNLTPTTPATKIITIFYGLNGIVLILMPFNIIRKVRGWDVNKAARELKERRRNDVLARFCWNCTLSGGDYCL